jgi:translation initiation factor 3 subunit L
MPEQRLALWNAEEDLEEEVDLSMAIGSYGPSVYDDGENPQMDPPHVVHY